MLGEEEQPSIVMDDDDDDPEDEESELSMSMKQRRHMSKQKKNRRRRRSSARFLKMGDISEENDENGNKNSSNNNHTDTNIGEVYKNAIRMNAENRINASNSWNLSLIDHLDRFLTVPSNSSKVSMEDTVTPGATTVNFTKASCTLDASVKIYSYRVDDVHLTSYKVLANLNRTDGGNKKNQHGGDDDTAMEGAESQASQRQEKRRATSSAETLETNLSNINLHKLDAAFDIDPLFHKMSKTFDEGGAKGLLLANLGVSDKGCNIVFDSTLEEGEEAKEAEPATQNDMASRSMDLSTLTSKLESTLGGQTVQQLPLVPQLESLRSDFFQLKEEGFVEKVKPSKRYAVSRQEEAEADRSIHLEAIERSRASQAELGRSLMAGNDDGDDSISERDDYAPADFGGDDDDDDGDVGDGFMGSFIHDGDYRFSSSSFQNSFEASQPPSQAVVLLDAIASGNISGSQSSYEYFNSAALKTIQGNTWAGAAHWKKAPRRKPKKSVKGLDPETPGAKRKGRTARKKNETRLNLLKPVENLDDLLRRPPKSKRGTDPLQMTKAAKTKYSKNENLLPLDLGLTVDTLTSLFMRPNSTVTEFVQSSSDNQRTKTVGFGGVETWGTETADDAYGGGDDDGGFGYNFGGDESDREDEDFTVPVLEGVRKVQKVQVGYATVAKKVDVKRLKRDLWEELERTFQTRNSSEDSDIEEIDEHGENMPATPKDDTAAAACDGPLSFHATVNDMQMTQSQVDVTLPFYFICVLHLANEKGLALESKGLEDFLIHSA